MARVVLSGLTKRFGDAVAVDHLDLTIEDGEFVSLLGPSGCGKTTTLRLLAGFLSPDEGEILVDGHRLSTPGAVVSPERRQMSMIFQSYAVWPHKTVFDNVAFGLKLRKVPRQEVERRAHEVLKLVQMRELATRYPGELSGGQQQRVALARALVVEPKILLLDEPLSNLDANLRDEMRFEIRRLHEKVGITTIYVTHDQAEAMVISDRIGVMHRGQLEQVGPPEQVYECPRTKFVAGFIGRTNCLEGVVAAGGRVNCATGLVLVVDQNREPPLAPGTRVAVSIRPQSVVMDIKGVERSPTQLNVLQGRVSRQAYLGEWRDYLVAIDGTDTVLRVITSSQQVFSPGEPVRLAIDPGQCRVIEGS